MVYKSLGYNELNFTKYLFYNQLQLTTPGNTRLTESNGIVKNVFYKTKNNDIVMLKILFYIYLFFTKKLCSGQILQNNVKYMYKSLNWNPVSISNTKQLLKC